MSAAGNRWSMGHLVGRHDHVGGGLELSISSTPTTWPQRRRDATKDFDTLAGAGNYSPSGIWSDGTTMWVADWSDDKLYAYNLATTERDAAKDFDTLADSWQQ